MFESAPQIIQVILNFANQYWFLLSTAPTPLHAAVILFVNGGWIFFILASLASAKEAWMNWRWEVYHKNNRSEWILLAIDVPRDNDLAPLAVENIFTHMMGMLPGSSSLVERYWEGKNTDYFSVELVSIDGYVQFLVYCQPGYRDMIESAFYAQYPDAEITEVEDYVHGQNGEFRDFDFHKPESEVYDLYGTEMVFHKPNHYPIRSWREFEDSIAGEFKDPMASLLENMNKIGPGEQIWLQWVLTPEFDDVWVPAGNKEIMKIAGKAEPPAPNNIVDKTVSALVSGLDSLATGVFPFYGESGEAEKKKDDLPSLMLHLTPGERATIEAIEKKIDRMAFHVKFRVIYIAKKEVFSKARGVAPVMGSLKQFSSISFNQFRSHKRTKTSSLYYAFVNYRLANRKNRILRAYQGRSRSAGHHGIILNTEEMASIYHFPNLTVKAPLVSRTESKRASAPISLPLEGSPYLSPKRAGTDSAKRAPAVELPETTEADEPIPSLPQNLPFL